MNQMKQNRKGQFGPFSIVVTAVLALVVIGLIGTTGSGIVSTQGATYTAGSAASNFSIATGQSIQNVGTQMPSMGTVAVFGAVIALLLGVVGFIGLRNR